MVKVPRTQQRPLIVVSWLAVQLAGLTGCQPPSVQSRSDGNSAINAQGDLVSILTGDSPNFAQLSNGTLMTVVSRDFGRRAKAGALVGFYYPNYAQDQLWDSYIGISSPDGFHWAHELPLVNQRLVDDSGVALSTFRGSGYQLEIADLVRPGANTHLRRVTVTNSGSADLTGLKVTFYGYFILDSTPNDNRIAFSPRLQALVQSRPQRSIAVASSRTTTQWQCGDALLPLGSARDARIAAEGGQLPGNSSAGPVATGVNGALRCELDTVQPGSSATVLYAISAASSEGSAAAEAQSAISRGWQVASQEDSTRWSQLLSQCQDPPGLAEPPRRVYRRALITLAQHVANDGALIAAPSNLSPPYRFVWLRDGAYCSLALQAAGYPAPAQAFFPFIEKMQRPDGGWAINYYPDASRAMWEFGPSGDEHDEVAAFPWGVDQVYARSQDRSWLTARWPAVQKACDFLLRTQDSDGLIGRCRDLWELDSGIWTYTNAASWSGLEAGSRIAKLMDDLTDAARYEAAADRIANAVNRQLVSQGIFVRGLRGNNTLAGSEAANLALGQAAFGMVADGDPRMRATGAQIAERLTTDWGGIRRYEGDNYYGPNPWPVTTGWLALHEWALGDQAGAQRQFGAMTRYAQQTGSLMLGEQFDESQARWVSAMPLAWSEAIYVKTVLALYGAPAAAKLAAGSK